MMRTILQDLRFALRQLRRSPALALTAVITLALGIGASTAIFLLLDQALLRSLPVRDPQQLRVFEGTGKAWQGHTSSHGGDAEAYLSDPMYRDLREQNHAFQGLTAESPTAHRRAKLSLTIATLGPVALSASIKTLPANRGICVVEKQMWHTGRVSSHCAIIGCRATPQALWHRVRA